jgi:hypothetical protein
MGKKRSNGDICQIENGGWDRMHRQEIVPPPYHMSRELFF